MVVVSRRVSAKVIRVEDEFVEIIIRGHRYLPWKASAGDIEKNNGELPDVAECVRV